MRMTALATLSLSALLAFDALAGEHRFGGSWKVDLRPTPDAEPYYKTFEIHAVKESSFSGEFYGTPFEDGVINTTWGKTYIAFTTGDGRTAYHHSAHIDGDVMHGRTHAPGRNFLSIWTARKSSD